MGKRFFALAVSCLLGIAGGPSIAGAGDTCSAPVSDTAPPILSDCLHIAKAGVGLGDCRDCLCDTDGSGKVSLSDALLCLRLALGTDIALECPECIASTTTTTILECASCNDVLTGAREYEELCPTAKILYDDMESCPMRNCRCACGFPQVCIPGFGDCCEIGSFSARECISCLSSCLETVTNCEES